MTSLVSADAELLARADRLRSVAVLATSMEIDRSMNYWIVGALIATALLFYVFGYCHAASLSETRSSEHQHDADVAPDPEP